jgi:hypothetical protein
MATHGDVAPVDLNIVMLHCMLRAFRFLLVFSLALFIFIFTLYVLISVLIVNCLVLRCCMQFFFPYAMLCMCILLMLQLLSYVISHALCIYMFLNVCAVTVFYVGKDLYRAFVVMLHCKPDLK